MKNKNLCLVFGLLGLLLFIGYLNESQHSMLGHSINIWVVRIDWLLIAIVNFIFYFEKVKQENKKKVKVRT